MALARFSASLKRSLYSPSFLLRAAQSRHIVVTTPRSDETTEADLGEDDAGSEPSPSLLETVEGKVAPVKARPYAEVLREIMAAKYLANQPLAKPHSLCAKTKASEKLTLQDLRVQYKQRVSSVRKQYSLEMEKKRAAKATQDKKQREEIRLAKEERLRLKKEKSAQRAIEVEEERRILQEQLANERAERRAYRKLMDMKVEERRRRERDVIRQQSGTWIDEKDLELKIVEALSNPIDL